MSTYSLSRTSAKVIAEALGIEPATEEAVRDALPGLSWEPARGNFPAMVWGVVVPDPDVDDAATCSTLSAVTSKGTETTRAVWRDDDGAIVIESKSGGERFRTRGEDLSANTGPVGCLILVADKRPLKVTTGKPQASGRRVGSPAAPESPKATGGRRK